jgi:hypothetical protein
MTSRYFCRRSFGSKINDQIFFQTAAILESDVEDYNNVTSLDYGDVEDTYYDENEYQVSSAFQHKFRLTKKTNFFSSRHYMNIRHLRLGEGCGTVSPNKRSVKKYVTLQGGRGTGMCHHIGDHSKICDTSGGVGVQTMSPYWGLFKQNVIHLVG